MTALGPVSAAAQAPDDEAFDAGAGSEGTSQPVEHDDEGSEPEHLTAFYRQVGLQPYFERRIQAILKEQWEEARAHADKFGVRRMSRSRYRRAIVALDRSTDARIRALIGKKKWAAWERARSEHVRDKAAVVTLTSRAPRAGGPAPRVRWDRGRCAELGRFLRGTALSRTTIEEAHFWIHAHARNC